ncbi:MAG: pirin family protein [Bacteroidetes bacterium]|nr:pirin family protein [Bacteroidota bacterium]MDA1335740.1 pirin family protein [Bacteroidota bacterium]
MSKRAINIVPASRVNMGGNWIEQPLPNARHDRIGPFLLIHHWQEVLPGNQSALEVGVGPHPHRGFSPVTCIYSGSLRHRDSLGTDHIVSAGGTQWMNSGSGIVHSERPSDELAMQGGLLEMIQFWVNTPRSHKMNPPSYQPLSSESTPNWTENNWSISLVQGKWGEHQSPIDAVHPMRILNLACEITESEIAVPLPADWVGAIYVLDGKARINEQPIEGRQIALVEEGTEESILLRCIEPSRILVLTGAVLNEPVFSHGPFVMNSIEELQRAIMDYHEGKMGTLEEETN